MSGPKDTRSGEVLRHHGQEGTEGAHRHHSHHHHHHHHHGVVYRLKRWGKKHKSAARGIAALLLLIVALGILLAARQIRTQNTMHVTGNDVDMGASYRVLTYEGKRYSYNQTITTVLYTGLDFTGELQTYPRRGMAPRCDSLTLIVLDKKHETMSMIPINRDTMCEIRRYSLFGDFYDYYVSNLAYAYAYGDGGESSINNVIEAVEKLLGVPVNDYVFTNRDSIEMLSALVGDVSVTVPNNDLVGLFPEMKEGATVTINKDNVERYVRYRNMGAHLSNVGRMERQRSYMDAYVQKLMEMLPNNQEKFWNELSEMEGYMQTSITKNKYLQYVNLLNKIDPSGTTFYKIDGEIVEAGHAYFYPDGDALRKMVLDIFYESA